MSRQKKKKMLFFGMTCYHPLVARRLKSWHKSYDPKKKIHILGAAKDYIFDEQASAVDDTFLLPCGHCIGCRIDNAREWSVRLCNEAETSSSAWFLTLTYDDDHLPADMSIHKSHVQDFIKNLRNYQYYYFDTKNIRYLVAGEYGSKSGRAHYHMILYNATIPDLKVQFASGGNLYYSSELFNSIWNQGFIIFAQVCLQTAQYVARYTLKKLGFEDYSKVNIESPFILMSTRPGIGYDYCVKHAEEIYARNAIKLPNGKFASIPKYYLKVLEKLDFDVDKLRRVRRELSFDNDFMDYIHGIDFYDFRQSEEVGLSAKTNMRGKL